MPREKFEVLILQPASPTLCLPEVHFTLSGRDAEAPPLVPTLGLASFIHCIRHLARSPPELCSQILA